MPWPLWCEPTKLTANWAGHIASYASAAEIFEVGFNHFFRARSDDFAGDLVYFQPHSAPGVYARAFLEGRLSEADISNYRQEVPGKGLCSYPHPWLMSEFWQMPTGSMGIGPMSAIYQARFMRYLQARDLASTQDRHVWGVFGDGEMDEPESIGALTLAAREGLDNLTFIINCNLQRLDGPVRGNGQIIQELEALFPSVPAGMSSRSYGALNGIISSGETMSMCCCAGSPKPWMANIKRSARAMATTIAMRSLKPIRLAPRWSSI